MILCKPMYKNFRVAIVVPCYNEEKLVTKTLTTIPDFVDKIIAVNDGSKDNTLKILKEEAKKNKKIEIINNEKNSGLGKSMLNAFEKLEPVNIDFIGVMAGDAQMDPEHLPKLLDTLIDFEVDVAKANRFSQNQSLESMPLYRKIGNIIVSILTKFSTGYYSIFDSQNGYVVYRKKVIDAMPKNIIGHRYEYENTVLVALSIVGAKIKDVPIPAVYGEEKSTINLLGTTLRTIKALNKGFWQRIYYKYVLYSFHPIALFLFGGLISVIFGLFWFIVILYEKILSDQTPSTATVMLTVLPIIMGLQLLLTAIILDVNEEKSGK